MDLKKALKNMTYTATYLAYIYMNSAVLTQ